MENHFTPKTLTTHREFFWMLLIKKEENRHGRIMEF